MDLRKATAEAVQIKGLDIINNLTFINILNDFGAFKGNPSYKPIIKALIEKHFFRNIHNNNLNDKERELDVFIHLTGFDKDKVNFIVNEIQLGSSLTNLKGNLQSEENEGFDLKEVYCVKKDGKWGYIDLYGEVIVPIIYTGLSKITDRGIYVAAKYKRNLNRYNESLYNYKFKFFYEKNYICDFPGGEIEKIKNESQVNCNMLTSKFEINDHSHYLIPDKWQLYSIYSEEPLSDEYADIETCLDWKSNVWETVKYSSQKRKRGLISSSGNEILSNKYEKIVVWDGNIYAYENAPHRIENKRNTIYLFKLNGELVNTFFEEDVFLFNDSIYSFRLNNKWGLKNFSNNVLIPPIYDMLSKTLSGDLFIAGIEISARRPLPAHDLIRKFKLINIENKILTKNDYSDICEILFTKFNHIFLGWWKEGGIEIFNEEGKILIKKEVIYLENRNSIMYSLINDKEYLALNCKNDAKENGFFIFNEDGKVILDFSLGQVVDINSEGFIFKRENNKFRYSLINNRISFVESNEKSIIFSYMGRFGIKNDSGSIIINPIYDKIKQLNESCIDIDLSKNIYICKKEGKWGVLNHLNKIIIPFKYDSIEFSISKTGIYFIVSCNQKYGVLNESGLITIPIIYDVIRPLQTFKI